ncbi:MAG: metallophosphoesterase [Planctomycetes bacterium]|nr:metallophosphoesterase [Planctomycetota bacterium]
MITMSLREGISLLIFLLLLLFLYGAETLLLVDYVWGRICKRPGKSELFARRYLILHLVAVVGVGCWLYGRFIEPNWVEVHVTTIHTPKLKTAGFRIVQISDLHCDGRIRNEEKMVQIINSLKPDVIVATGDYLNHTSGLPHLRDALTRLQAPLGKFAVLGNQDGGWPRLPDLLDGAGFRWLNQEAVTVAKGPDSLGISGLNFVRSHVPIDSVKALPSDRFNVFLYHTPDLVEDVSGPGIDLYLCGHTHGGQVALPWYGALITFSKFGKKYETGLYRVGQTTLYVNRGLGLEPRPGPQVRFLARPEIAVFDIVPEQP